MRNSKIIKGQQTAKSGTEAGALRVLILEDKRERAGALQQQMDRAGLNTVIQQAGTLEAFTRSPKEFNPDIVLSSHPIAPLNAVDALHALRDLKPTTPLLIVPPTQGAGPVRASERSSTEGIVTVAQLGSLGQAVQSALSARRPLWTLTPRQLEVLRLLTQGHPRSEIARQMKVSVKTVEAHRAEVMRRLGIKNLAGLVRYAVFVGLIAPKP